MKPWEKLATGKAPDGKLLELRRRGDEYLILAGGYDLMSNEDESSSRALGTLGCAHLPGIKKQRVLVGGLGMGFTARAVLDCCARSAHVDVADLVPAIADWNRDVLGHLADHPLRDGRLVLTIAPVQMLIRRPEAPYHAILLDVDNGPDALAHDGNSELYSARGIEEAWRALTPGGVFGVWSFSDDVQFTNRLKRQGFTVKVHRVEGSRKGRGRHHRVWIATKPAADAIAPSGSSRKPAAAGKRGAPGKPAAPGKPTPPRRRR